MSEYVTIKEAAERSRLSVRQLQRFMKQDRDPLPYCKIGRSVRFKVTEFNAWMDKHRTSKASLNSKVEKALKSLR